MRRMLLLSLVLSLPAFAASAQNSSWDLSSSYNRFQQDRNEAYQDQRLRNLEAETSHQRYLDTMERARGQRRPDPVIRFYTPRESQIDPASGLYIPRRSRY